jgi:hypothetical protein
MCIKWWMIFSCCFGSNISCIQFIIQCFRLVGVSCLRIQFFERIWPCEIIYLKHFQWYHIIPWPLQHMFVELINFEYLISKIDISPNIQLNSLFSFRFFWGNFQHFENKLINVDLAQILIGNKKMECYY